MVYMLVSVLGWRDLSLDLQGLIFYNKKSRSNIKLLEFTDTY